MVKRVIWTLSAKQEKKEILTYWRKRNKSNAYPKKLNKLLKLAIQSLATSTFPRNNTDDENVSVKIVKDYMIFFEEDVSNIYILCLWDCRQDPNQLKNLLK